MVAGPGTGAATAPATSGGTGLGSGAATRRGGSCAVDLCSVAAGRVDAYYERGVNYWDYAAGGLVAREAGALLAGLAGRPVGPDLVVAAEPGLFGQLHDALLALDPERDGPAPGRAQAVS